MCGGKCYVYSEGEGGNRDSLSYSIFESLFIIGRCLVNINVLAAKMWDLQMSLTTQNVDFF